MADNQIIKNAIRQAIKNNGANNITGQVAQDAFVNVIEHFGAGRLFVGVVTPSSPVQMYDQNVFYLAFQQGVYLNLGSVRLNKDHMGIIYNENNTYRIDQVKIGYDDTATLAEIERLKVDVYDLQYPIVITQDPAPVDDLAQMAIDSNAITFSWTSRSGDGPASELPAHRYVLYLSNGQITPLNYTRANKIVLPLTPKLPGEMERYTVTGLDADTVYYAVLEVETFDRITRKSGISNSITFRTKATVVPEGESSYLKMDPDNAITYVKRFDTDPETGLRSEPGYSLDGEIVSLAGAPSPESLLGKSTLFSYTGWKPAWPQENPIRFVIDMEVLHRIDYIYVMVSKNISFQVYTAVIGTDWVSAGEAVAASNIWRRFDLPAQARQGRYIKFEFPAPLNIHEIALYGSKVNAELPVGIKHQRISPTKSFWGFLGTNSFMNESAQDYRKFGKIVRYYSNHNWMTPLSTQTPTQTFSLDNTNPVPYQFETSRMWDFDAKLAEAVSLGIEPFWCSQGTSNWLLPADKQNKLEYWPSDTRQIPSSTDLESPFTYRYYSQYLFQVAARYGRNSNIPDSLFRLAPEETIKKGLGYIRYMEAWNEPDKTWETEKGYFSPYMLAAFLSACYDGHKGEMGPGYGIRQADPSMIMVMPGLTEINIDYFRYMVQWWDTHRGIGDYPMSVFNFHIYSNTSGGNQVDNTRKGAQPEVRSYMNALKKIVEFRDKYYPEMEIWISETGYDQHPASNQAPPANIGERMIGEIKADWLLRTFLVNYMLGIDAVQQYMYRGAGDTLAQITGTGFPSVYLTSGYVDYVGSPENRYEKTLPDGTVVPVEPRLTAYFYTVAFLKDMEGMEFSHIIKSDELFVNGLFASPPESLYAVAFKPSQGSSKNTSCIIVWHASSLDQHTVETLAVDASQVIKTSVYRDIELTKSEVSNTVNISPRTDLDLGRVIDIEVNETPLVIWTNKTGKPKIFPVNNLKAKSGSTSSVRLTWEDPNIADGVTKIFRSQQPDRDFVKIVEDYIPECFYSDENLASGTYYYMVELVSSDLSNSSGFSNTVAVTTMEPIQGVTALNQVSANINRISIGWAFPEASNASITGFEVFRSSTPTGTYNRRATLSNTVRSYLDTGLVENTTYYYKVRAFSPLGYSEFSGTLAATTSEAQMQPPVPVFGNTSFYGDKVFLLFNIPIKNTENNAQYFSVYEEGATTPIKTISSLVVDHNEQRLVIQLSTPVESGSNPIRVGYDGLGTLASVFNIPVESFQDYAATNLKDSESLITREAVVSLNSFNTPQYSPEAGENFNELFFTGNTSQEQVVNNNLVDTEGNSLPWTVIAPYVANTYVMEASSAATPVADSTDPNDPFPLKARRSGRMESNYTAAFNTVAFMGLDMNKKYDVKVFVTHSAATPDPRMATGRVQENALTLQEINVAQNIENLFHWENVAPANIALGHAPGAEIPNITAPKIIVQTKSSVRAVSIVTCAYYIREVTEFIPEI